MDTVIMRRVRMGHIPHPPSWKASASSLRTVMDSSFGLTSGIQVELSDLSPGNREAVGSYSRKEN
jgi:hypothetical protein